MKIFEREKMLVQEGEGRGLVRRFQLTEAQARDYLEKYASQEEPIHASK